MRLAIRFNVVVYQVECGHGYDSSAMVLLTSSSVLVSAFANGSGGALIFGIADDDEL